MRFFKLISYVVLDNDSGSKDGPYFKFELFNVYILSINSMYNQISKVITKNKTKMIYQINNTLIETNFLIGKIIVENEQNGNIRSEYGKDILKKLSKKLTNEFGSGFSLSGLHNMRLFYNRYKNFQPLAGNLS